MPDPDHPNFAEQLQGVAYGGGVFVAVGAYKRYRWDGNVGNVWLDVSDSTSGKPFLRAVAYGTPAAGGLFAAVGDGAIVTSTNGVNWVARVPGTTDILSAIAFGNQRFVAAGETGTVLTSTDGITWSTSSPFSGEYIRTLTFDGSAFVGVTAPNGRVMTSVQGSSWTQAGVTVPPALGIAYGFDTYIVVATGGVVRESVDKSTWTPVALNTSGAPLSGAHLAGVAYGDNRFLAVAAQGDILRSGEYPSAELKNLTCSAGALNPMFTSELTAYGIDVGSDIKIVTVTPESKDVGATIQVRFGAGSDELVSSGDPSMPAHLSWGRSQKFYVTVTARNSATRVYTLTVYRKPLAWLWKLLPPWFRPI